MDVDCDGKNTSIRMVYFYTLYFTLALMMVVATLVVIMYVYVGDVGVPYSTSTLVVTEIQVCVEYFSVPCLTDIILEGSR